jgi:hypothetical protein
LSRFGLRCVMAMYNLLADRRGHEPRLVFDAES